METWGRPLEIQTMLIPKDHHLQHNLHSQLVASMQWDATSTSVVTSVSKIRLWQSGVTDDDWWVWLLVQGTQEKEPDSLTLLEHMEKCYVRFADVYSNRSLQFNIPSTIISFLFFVVFFFSFGFSLTFLKEQATYVSQGPAIWSS